MNAGLSTLFGLAAALAGVLTFAIMFVIRTRDFLPSVAMAALVASVLFGISVFFDRRDARAHRRPYERVLPRRQGVIAFAFVLYLLVALIGFVAVVIYGWIQIPAGDDWGLAATRLGYCITIIVLGWQTSNAVIRIAHRIFGGHVYSDFLESLGEPITWKRVCEELNQAFPAFLLIVFAAISIAILLDAHEWVQPILDGEGKSRTVRKYRLLLSWILNHPNSTDLFAGTVLGTCTCLIVWRLYRFTCADTLLNDDRE